MNEIETLQTIVRMLGALAILQGAEFIAIHRSVQSVWRWEDLEPELGTAFGVFLRPGPFLILNIGRVLCGLYALLDPNAPVVWILFIAHILTLLRWLGTFNGGSDYMNLLLLWTCALALSAGGKVVIVCLYYMTFQLCLSYFRAGWIKLKNPGWRSGDEMRSFLTTPNYQRNAAVDWIAHSRRLSRTGSWIVIAFELTFPLALLNPELAKVYVITGGLFHLGNSYVFGLNRFFFAWLAGYPALLFVSGI